MNPGEGYRLLMVGEPILGTDELEFEGQWEPFGVPFLVGDKVCHLIDFAMNRVVTPNHVPIRRRA